MHRSRILKHAFSSVLQAAATLTGFEPNLKFSRLCAIPLQTCSMLRVRGQNTNQAVCTNRAELRSSSVSEKTNAAGRGDFPLISQIFAGCSFHVTRSRQNRF